MSGPGDIGGPTSASIAVTPTSAITHPAARSGKSFTGRRIKSQMSNARSEATKKYAPQPSKRNNPSAAYAPDRPQAVAILVTAVVLAAAGAPSMSAGRYVTNETVRNNPSANSPSASTSNFRLR